MYLQQMPRQQPAASGSKITSNHITHGMPESPSSSDAPSGISVDVTPCDALAAKAASKEAASWATCTEAIDDVEGRMVVVNVTVDGRNRQVNTSGTNLPSLQVGSMSGPKPGRQAAPQRALCGIVSPLEQTAGSTLAMSVARGVEHERFGWHTNEPVMVPLWQFSCPHVLGS